MVFFHHYPFDFCVIVVYFLESSHLDSKILSKNSPILHNSMKNDTRL